MLMIVIRLVSTEPVEISTSVPPRTWFSYIIGFPGLTAIGSMVPLLLIAFCYIHTPSGKAPGWVLVCALLFGMMVACWLIYHMANPFYWCLTQSEIIGGMTKNRRYPLSSIEKIILGLPYKMPAVVTAMVPGMGDRYPAMRQASILVIFQNGAALPLSLRATVSGSLLMDTLVKRLENRVVRNYAYSEKETKLLRTADPNTLIRNYISRSM